MYEFSMSPEMTSRCYIYSVSPKELEKFYVSFGAILGRIVVTLVALLEIMYTELDTKLLDVSDPREQFGYSLVLVINIALLMGAIVGIKELLFPWILYYSFVLFYAGVVLSAYNQLSWIPGIHFSSVARHYNKETYHSLSKFSWSLFLTTSVHYLVVCISYYWLSKQDQEKKNSTRRNTNEQLAVSVNIKPNRATSSSNNNNTPQQQPPSYREATSNNN